MEHDKINRETSRAHTQPTLDGLDLVCFSHLGWDFVYQRPQHLMSRWARERRVFYIEEPVVRAGPTQWALSQDPSGVRVAIPYLADSLSREEAILAHRALIDKLFAGEGISGAIHWYYTPLAMAYTRQLDPALVVYDCMDELSAFSGASSQMHEREAELLARADVVFTGGYSLYEAKRGRHPNVHAFPSSIDKEHFSQARAASDDPPDQVTIPHPRLGFFGVIDERMDLDLVAGIADARPDWHLIMVGPVAKVPPERLVQRSNIHYLGIKTYEELPRYLAGWDVGILPFAQNESTRFISPTKTPEYLAGGKRVVSTPIPDVIRSYGEAGLVAIADGPAEFVGAVQEALAQNGAGPEWLRLVDQHLAQDSWDHTFQHMKEIMELAIRERDLAGRQEGHGNGKGE